MCEGCTAQSLPVCLWSMRHIGVRWWQPPALNTQVTSLRSNSPNPLVAPHCCLPKLHVAPSPMPSTLYQGGGAHQIERAAAHHVRAELFERWASVTRHHEAPPYLLVGMCRRPLRRPPKHST